MSCHADKTSLYGLTSDSATPQPSFLYLSPTTSKSSSQLQRSPNHTQFLYTPITMQYPTFFLTFLLSLSVVTNGLSFFGNDQAVINDDLKVPGDNPLQFCSDPSDDILKIEYVDLDPNPPKAYVPLTTHNIVFWLIAVAVVSINQY
jgi:hypothetical protein